MVLEPYIFFYGRCEEALEFYKGVFNGTYEMQRNNEMPPDAMAGMPPISDAWKSKVMHSTFKGNGFQFMASDGMEGKTIDPDEGNIDLSIGCESNEDAERIFAALSQGGSVMMPLADSFWGSKFGMLTDKFGIEWMVVGPR